MTKPRLRLAAVFVAATSAPAASLGFDVGAPTFLDEGDEAPRFHFETAFVSQERDLILRYNRLRGGPLGASAPTGFGSTPASAGTDVDGEFTQLRWVFHATPRVSGQFQVGLGGESNTGDSIVSLGGAVRYLIASEGPLQLSAQGSANVIPEFQERFTGQWSTGEDVVSWEQQRFHEYALAVLGSVTLQPHEDVTVMTYFVPRVSAYRGGIAAVMDVDSPTPGADMRLWVDGTAREKTDIGAVLGLQAEWLETWTLRAEARLGDEQSFTVGFGAKF